MPHPPAAAPLTTALLLGLLSPLAAETRGKPFTEPELRERCRQVFVGEVLETRTFESYKRTVPVRVRVLKVLKGPAKPEVRQLTPKHPGGFVYFDEEFDPARVGDRGTFYVGDRLLPSHSNLLMGYRKTPPTPAARQPGAPKR